MTCARVSNSWMFCVESLVERLSLRTSLSRWNAHWLMPLEPFGGVRPAFRRGLPLGHQWSLSTSRADFEMSPTVLSAVSGTLIGVAPFDSPFPSIHYTFQSTTSQNGAGR